MGMVIAVIALPILFVLLAAIVVVRVAVWMVKVVFAIAFGMATIVAPARR